MENHGKGQDATSLRRTAHHDAPRAIAATLQPDGSWTNSLAVDGPGYDVKRAFANHKKITGGKERKATQIGLHLLLGVTPDWVSEVGDKHDAHNPRNVALLNAAVHWAKGEGLGPYAARIDLNETGGAVADVFCAPVRKMRTGRSRKMVPWISPRRAKHELAERHGWAPGRSYSAMQDGWAAWCRKVLDTRLERGTPKVESGREHLSPEDYAAAQAELRRELAPAVKAKAQEQAERIIAEARTKANQRAAAVVAQANAEGAAQLKRAEAESAALIEEAEAERAERLKEAEAREQAARQAAWEVEEKSKEMAQQAEAIRIKQLIVESQHEEISGLYSELRDRTRKADADIADIKEQQAELDGRKQRFEKMARGVVERLKKRAYKLRGHVRNNALRAISFLAEIAGISAGEMRLAPARGSATPAASSTSGAGQANPRRRQRRPSGAEMGKN